MSFSIEILQVMLDRLLNSSFYSLLGAFLRDPLFPIGYMMMSLHFLLMLRLLWVSQPIMAVPTKLSSCACAINPEQITACFISPTASEGKTSPVH